MSLFVIAVHSQSRKDVEMEGLDHVIASRRIPLSCSHCARVYATAIIFCSVLLHIAVLISYNGISLSKFYCVFVQLSGHFRAVSGLGSHLYALTKQPSKLNMCSEDIWMAFTNRLDGF